jgi:endonuclease/exonuclease/phosphatase family metal-dependent hydrolase
MKKLQVWLLLFATTNAFGQLSVMSYNIRYDTAADSLNAWAYRKADLVSFLQFHHPQIIGLQEALHHQIQYIDSALTQYSFVGVGRDDGAQLGEFSPILYDSSRLYMIRSGTFWLSETPEKPSQGWDAALPRICTWAIFEKKNEHQQFLCMNAHFDHLGERARLESSILIAHRLAEISDEQNWPVIVMWRSGRDSNPRPRA